MHVAFKWVTLAVDTLGVPDKQALLIVMSDADGSVQPPQADNADGQQGGAEGNGAEDGPAEQADGLGELGLTASGREGVALAGPAYPAGLQPCLLAAAAAHPVHHPRCPTPELLP